MEILIIGTHQTYLKSYAGGYVRLREFIKRFPSEFNYKVIDVRPSIYEDIVEKDKLILFNNPRIVKLLLTLFFPLGVLCERVWMGFSIYKLAKKNIKNGKALIYVPIGDLLHLYIPAIILKKEFPQSKLLIDILNFGVIEKNIFQLTNKLKKNSNLFTSFILATFYLITFFIIKNTIKKVDFVFTVSKDLITEIKKIYPKNTIDYTPSGVSVNVRIPKKTKKKYLGVYVGRVTEQKGIYNLLEVWREVVKEKPEAKLAIAGFMDIETSGIIKSRIEKFGLEKNIVIFGAVTEEDKYKILSESEIFLHLANCEPLFPVIGILEGLISGLPCVVFDMPVLKAEVSKTIKNNFVFVISNGNIQEASKVIVEYDSYPKSKKIVISNKAKQFASKFDWNEIANKEFLVIKNLIKQ